VAPSRALLRRECDAGTFGARDARPVGRWRWREILMRGVVVDVPRAWRRANRRRVAHCGVECEET
jgi:hypothetical protein